MKKLIELTDALLLGTDGWSDAEPRHTARAVLRNSDGLYAVMYAKKSGLYALPGGGIEDGESIIDALKREILEETGCFCDAIEELGYVYENRAECDFTQYSYYYAVTSSGPLKSIELTDEEIENGTLLLWYPLDKVISLIENFCPETTQQKYLQARDIAALTEYREQRT